MRAFSIFLLTLFVISINCLQQTQLTQELDKVLSTSIPLCIKENNINPSTIEVDPQSFPEDEKTKCFVKCVAVRIGIMTEAGQFQLKDFLAKTQLPHHEDRDQWMNELEKCDKQVSLDACETAFVGFKCFVDWYFQKH